MPTRRSAASHLDAALSACVEMTALGPQPSVERFVAVGHGCIAAAVGSSSGHVGIAVRHEAPPGDPLFGWRLPVFYAIGARSQEEGVEVGQEIREETYLHDPVVLQVIRDSGRHRLYHDPHPSLEPERAGTLDEKYWTMFKILDRVKLVFEVEPDVALHFAFDRVAGAAMFSARDLRVLNGVLDGLGPWARRVALLHGCLSGCRWLSPRERELACALLGHSTVKEMAHQLKMSEARARELVRAVYRKLRVSSRAELASSWAGTSATRSAQLIAVAAMRRPSSRTRRDGQRLNEGAGFSWRGGGARRAR